MADFHNIGGKKYPRVTSILGIIHSHGLEKLQRIKGFRKMDEIFKEKAEFGNRFHNVCEEYAKGKINQSSLDIIKERQPDIYKRLLNFSAVIKPKIKKILLTEKKFVAKGSEYSGTLDFIYERTDGFIILADIKTGIELDVHKLQIAAYKHLVDINTKFKVNSCELWYINEKSAKIKTINKTEIRISYMLFICALNLHKEFKQ